MKLTDFTVLTEASRKAPPFADDLEELTQLVGKLYDMLKPNSRMITGIKAAEGDDWQKYHARYFDKLRRMSGTLLDMIEGEDSDTIMSLLSSYHPAYEPD